MASIIRVGERWRAQVRRKGHKEVTKTFKLKAKAQAWARDLEARIDAGTVVTPSSRLTVAALIHAYRELREAARPILDASNEHYMLKQLEEGLGDKLAHGLRPVDLVNFAKDRNLQGAGQYTVLMEVSKLGTVIRYAGVGLGLPDIVGQARPLLNHAGLIGGGGKRERRPTDDELGRITKALPPHFATIVQFMVVTAMRRGEVVNLRWSDVDWEKRLILIRDRKDPRRKAGNDQWIPLLGEAWEIVSSKAERGIDSPIFPHHPQTLSKSFKAACDSLGIIDLHLHDLRHEGISRMFEQGYTIEQVALVSGHKDWRHLKRYTNLRPESLHALPAVSGQDTQPRRAHLQIVSRRPDK